jgi:hypothetical protein
VLLPELYRFNYGKSPKSSCVSSSIASWLAIIATIARPKLPSNCFAPNLLNYEESLYTSLRRALRPPVSCAIR